MVLGMVLLVSLVQAGRAGRATTPRDACLECHRLEDSKITALHERGVHARAGIGCAGCHGGDPRADNEKDAHSPRAGFAGRLDRESIPARCAACHGDRERMRKARLDPTVYRDWQASRHGRLAAKGDPRAPICTDCHGAHGIRSRVEPQSPTHRLNIASTCGSCHSDPVKMGASRLPTNQEAEYRAGIHGRILYGEREGDPALVPTCVDCHGGHGAVPPDARSVPEVCGSCHYEERTYLRMSPHADSLRFTGEPSCKDCHGNHHNTIPPEGLQEKVCLTCHKGAQDRATREAARFAALLARGGRALRRFDELVDSARPGSQEAMLLQAERERAARIYSTLRKRSHSLDPALVGESVSRLERLVRVAEAVGERGVERNRGFPPTIVNLILGGLAAALFVTSVALALLLRRALLRRRDRGGGRPEEAAA